MIKDVLPSVRQNDFVSGNVLRLWLMLYFLFQPAPRDYPHLKLKRGSPMCKVLADTFDELIGWGRRYGLRHIHISRSGRPHYDLWGRLLVLCPHFNEMKRHRYLYRMRLLKRR